MKSTIIKAPAKVNLYLDVFSRRPDGYHNIETIFEKIDLCDWIKVSVIPRGIKLACEMPEGCENSALLDNVNNTAYRAAKLLCERYNLRCGFKIELDKRIPIASGLGGGSSDAAAVLLSICNLLNIKIEKQALLKLAAEIGADVPFFVSGYNRAFATGIGEQLHPLKQNQNMYFLLVVPDIKISTKSVYASLRAPKGRSNPKNSGLLRQSQAFGLRRNDGDYIPVNLNLTKKRRDVSMLCHNLENLAVYNIKDILFNKLEEVVLPSYPVLHDIKKALKKTGAEGIIVSGSGSVVYGVFQSRKEAMRAESKLMKKGNWQLFLARNC